jgi:hypothetical protein
MLHAQLGKSDKASPAATIAKAGHVAPNSAAQAGRTQDGQA